jgi:predicted regulator of Ras-like GTPase activity (Roadblock/LC7/MglB family)
MYTCHAIPPALALLLLAGNASAQPLGTAFTYQGQLTESGQAAAGLYDLQVCLFDSLANPLPIACAPDFGDVPVDAGVFTLALDFGAAPFAGEQRFLELRVRPGASTGGDTILAPRQLVRPTPEALRSAVSSAAPWSGLTGVPAGFADGIDNDSRGTVTSITAGTGLAGGVITGSGTIGIANGGVGTAQIAAGAVGTSQLANGAVTGTQLATNAVGTAALADNAVDTRAVQNLSITQAKIAAGAVGSTQLAAGAVGTAQINPAQVQARITGTCAIGEYFRGINPDGSVACEPVPGVPRITVVDDPANSVGEDTSIAIGADGLPVISYRDSTALALKVAKCANAACTGVATITTVDDPVNSVGAQTSIAIGTDGLPVVSYFDNTAGALKVAKCANAACTGVATITTVDDPANAVGFFTSIAIGADGLPVISYFDNTADALRVAKCGTRSCQ